MVVLKPIAVDALVRWAYRIELPKEPPAHRGASFLRRSSFVAPWAALSKSGELGTEVDETDRRNRYGLFSDATALEGPHPDAIRVWYAVKALDSQPLVLFPNWKPLSDVSGGVDAADQADAIERGIERVFYHRHDVPEVTWARHGARVERVPEAMNRRLGLRRPASELVQKHAVLGGCPSWETEPPVRRAVRNSHGGPAWFRMVDGVEVNGFDPKARRPGPDAYEKHYYDPDLAELVEARAEYWVWHNAMLELAGSLRGALDAHDVMPPSVPKDPWGVTPALRQPKVIVAA